MGGRWEGPKGVVVRVVSLNGRPAYRLTQYGYDVGLYRSEHELAAALGELGVDFSELHEVEDD